MDGPPGAALDNHRAGLGRDAHGRGAQVRIDAHGLAPPGFAIEQRAFRDRVAEHRFQPQALRAQLHCARPCALGRPRLYAIGKGCAASSRP